MGQKDVEKQCSPQLATANLSMHLREQSSPGTSLSKQWKTAERELEKFQSPSKN